MRFLMGAVCGIVVVTVIQQVPKEKAPDMRVDLAEYHVKELWRRWYQVDPKDDDAAIRERKDFGSAEQFFVVSKLYFDGDPRSQILDGEVPLKFIRSKQLPHYYSGVGNASAFNTEMDKATLKETDKAYAELLKANRKYLDELEKAVKVGFKAKIRSRS